MTRTAILAAAVVASALVAGCGGADVKTTTTTISIGQQLIDLKTARDSGAISEQEYQRARKALVDKSD